MKINIFEGARRISLIIGVLWVIGCLSFAIFNKPYQAQEEFNPSKSTPAKQVQSAQSSDSDWVDYQPTNKAPSTNAIQDAGSADEANSLDWNKIASSGVPINSNKNSLNELDWNKIASSGVPIEKPENKTSTLQAAANGAAISKHSTAILEQWKDSLLFLFGGVAGGWAFVAAIGWIIRGFMGIPRGKDSRTTD